MAAIIEKNRTKTAKKSSKQGTITLGTKISEEERRRMIAEAAYYHAERRGFIGSDSLADWLAAETEVDALIGRHT